MNGADAAHPAAGDEAAALEAGRLLFAQDCRFVAGVADLAALPPPGLPEIAFAGRSNVGKSSLVNALVRRRIARAGAQPGTTRLLNVYRVHAAAAPRGAVSFSFVDLPGYGYARGGEQTRRDFDALTSRFFTAMVKRPGREQAGAGAARLAGALLVVDVRHPGLENDRAAHAWLTGRGCPVVVAATKADRLSRSARSRARGDHEAVLGCPVQVVSSRTGDGIAPLWSALAPLVTGRER